MNPYLKNLKKIEFVVTDACTGHCKHCSQGEHTDCRCSIDPVVAADMVKKVAAIYPIETVMTFGGEPLLSPEAVAAIHSAASEMNIPRRQVITNGYFTRDLQRMREVAKMLASAGVNDILLSVDAFHQETIPEEVVAKFARALLGAGLPVRTQPAWLVSAEDDNPYNRTTRAILARFADLGISANDGNVIFPEGNAKVYLAEYFGDAVPENPYVEDPFDLYCLSVDAEGSLLGMNLRDREVTEIMEAYRGKESEKKGGEV